jgi:hypothetical protein
MAAHDTPSPGAYTPHVKKAQVLGLVLWRGGLLLVGASALYHGARLVLRFVDLPVALEVAGSLVLAGLLLVLVSMVMENLEESRRGGGEQR